MNLSFADMSDDILDLLKSLNVLLCPLSFCRVHLYWRGVALGVWKSVFWWKIVSSLIGIDVWFQSSLLQTNRLVPAFSARNAARSSTPIRLGMLQDAADHNSRRATKIENCALIMLRGLQRLVLSMLCVLFCFLECLGNAFKIGKSHPHIQTSHWCWLIMLFGFSWAPVIASSCRPSSCTGSSSTTQTDTKRIEQLPGKVFFKTVSATLGQTSGQKCRHLGALPIF